MLYSRMFYLILILCFYIGFFIIDFIIEYLNMNHVSETIPTEFEDVYDAEKYANSQRYLKENTIFSLIQSTLSLCITVPFILFGGFNFVDVFVRSFGFNELITGIVYMLLLMFVSQLISLPFSYYSTFVIEEKYGFNKTTKKTFMLDLVKSTLLSIVIGMPILAALLWFFETTGSSAWLICWGFVTVVQLIITFLAPTLIMPLFNKFSPLADGDLKTSIEDYARQYNFKLNGVFTMDGSKRSSKSNAFFTGFGKFRRIVLFDTLIQKHTVNELLVVLAHEMGHFKKHHILQHILFSIATSGLMFYILSFFINNPDLAAAFKMDTVSIYTSLIFFGFLISPIQTLLSIITNIISRKNEFEADEFAVTTTGLAADMVSALKKLSVDNLSNLTPHPAKVFIEYSHPPVLKRIARLNKNI
ncbi:peptidase M48 [Candidatus Marinamargulisbacteria bacterium SCGC AG-414-C22]|nr:peptidase M48 [Candidatus Marinamargulisbacteria bacterium SCGC AG-414-C22]